MSELLEQESSVEQGPDGLEQIQLKAIATLQEKGVSIDRDRWHKILPSVECGDLNSAESNDSTAEYRPNRIFLEVKRNGHVTVDLAEFNQLGEYQQQHWILHEAGHRLDWLISATGNEQWREIGDIIAKMDFNEVSFYIAHLANKYKDIEPEKLAAILRQEAMPELIAQYVESDGTFKSFVEARMRSGAGQKGEEAWAGRAEVDSVMAKLDRFESMIEEEKEAFFIEHPRFQNRHKVFVSMGEALNDKELIESITTEWGGDYSDGFYDESELVSEMTPELPQALNAPIKEEVPPKPPVDWFDLLWPFRKDS